jgi:hypothetical protein
MHKVRHAGALKNLFAGLSKIHTFAANLAS